MPRVNAFERIKSQNYCFAREKCLGGRVEDVNENVIIKDGIISGVLLNVAVRRRSQLIDGLAANEP